MSFKGMVGFSVTGIFALMVGAVYAEEEEQWYLVDPLPTMNPELPDTYHCLRANCSLDGVDRWMNIRLTNGYETVIQETKMFRGFICEDGLCFDYQTREEVGVTHHDGKRGGVYPYGYYFVTDSPEHLQFHRRGTGPYADYFPAFLVYGEEEEVIQDSADEDWSVPQGIANNVDIWCDPMTDECRLDGELVLHDELPDHLKMADINDEQGQDHWCDGPVCYDNSENFIGLNPFFY